ncbi:hypothetical protein M0L20_17990 [Spirosoma sp. RP8]|uniref:Lipocalin-like domain-containing protein n=1 Tax=Spirosoma liriopis TaxID=2937440 RepID=A0ABT0HQ40_9BACT|nr:hypothetical protein [Spirosoma liriopis]MCK8493763.1 hypothetical protein [Spirosoma liriopis]
MMQPMQGLTGDYRLTGTASYTIEGAISSEPVSGTLSIFAGSSPQYYYFLERTNKGRIGFLTTHTNTRFSIESVQDYTRVGSATYFGYLDNNSQGTVENDSIVYDRYADTENVGITSPTGERITFSKKIRKHVHLVATR